MLNTRKIIWQLQQTNEKAYYLAVLRILTCIWFLKELFFRWPAFEVLYSNNSFLKIKPAESFHLLRLDPYLFREHHMAIIYVCIILLLLNIFGVGRNLVAVLLFLALTLLYSINNKFGNGGDKMALLLVFYLSLANTFSHFTLIKRKPLSPDKEKLYNLLSNLASYSIMLNLSLAYFMAGVSKLQEPYWQNGMAIHYFLNDDRYFVFAAGGQHVQFPAILSYAVNYGILLLEIIAPVLIWYKRYRSGALALLFLMHVFIYCFLMIFGMSIIFVIQYGLFFSNEEIRGAVQKVKDFFRMKRAALLNNRLKNS